MTGKKGAGHDDRAQDPMVICPVLGAMVQQGLLTPNARGEVDLAQVGVALARQMGASKPMAAAAAYTIAPLGNRIRDVLPNLLRLRFNPMMLTGGIIHHDGDSDVVSHAHYDEAAFQALIAHSTDGKTLSTADLAHVVRDNVKRDDTLDAKTRGVAFGMVEFAGLINLLGYIDDKGTRRIDIQTLRDVYQKKQLPQERMASRPKTGIVDFVGTLASMAWAMARGGGSGTARAGVAVAEGQRPLPIEDAIVGVGAATCPYLSQQTGLRPISASEVAAHHAAPAGPP